MKKVPLAGKDFVHPEGLSLLKTPVIAKKAENSPFPLYNLSVPKWWFNDVFLQSYSFLHRKI
jgi:hypothetical protein